MNVGSLFSGIGGIELGFEAEGFETSWFVEYEPYCREVLRKHFPNATIYGDITQIDFSTIPKVDILTGGFPCQDISNAGKRVGITGSRSSLWKYYLEAIRVLRPKYAVIENVSAIIGRGLDVVLADLAQVGYDAEWHCISASAIGAPHRRDRIIIIAYPNKGGLWKLESLRETSRLEHTNVISYPNRSRQLYRKFEEQSSEEWESSLSLSLEGGSDVTYSNLSETSRYREYCGKIHSITESEGFNECSSEGWWAVEPDVGRVADGISHRVDRIKCLGNAVVPQLAQVIAQSIKAELNKHE